MAGTTLRAVRRRANRSHPDTRDHARLSPRQPDPAIHMLVEAVFWFHPLVWWIEGRLKEERERACDEAAVKLIGRPDVYAESLLKACRFCLESPLTCVSGITGAGLNRRIHSIMTLRSDPLSRSKRFMIFCARPAVMRSGGLCSGHRRAEPRSTLKFCSRPARGSLRGATIKQNKRMKTKTS